MDSIKAHWREWGLFDNGRLPVGHMHSNLLQLALERGVPVLILWLVLMAVYARMLWRLVRSNLIDDWIERGIVLGALGGLCGFFSSGLFTTTGRTQNGDDFLFQHGLDHGDSKDGKQSVSESDQVISDKQKSI